MLLTQHLIGQVTVEIDASMKYLKRKEHFAIKYRQYLLNTPADSISEFISVDAW